MKQKQFLTILIVALMCMSIAQWALAADEESAEIVPAGASSETEAALAELFQSIEADKSAVVGDIIDRFATNDVTADQLEATLAGASAATLAEIIENADSLEDINSFLAGPEDALRVGDLTEDYTYTPVSPCRIVDTRKPGAGGAFSPSQSREYFVYGLVGAQGGSAICFSPNGEPRGVHLNVTAVPVDGSGNFKIYPANVGPPNASFVNYRSGVQNVANAGTVKAYYAIGEREIEVRNSFGNSHLVIDVLGYYHSTEHLAGADFAGGDQNLPLGATDTTVRSTSISAPAAGRVIVNASGYFLLSSAGIDTGRCSITTGTTLDASHLFLAGERTVGGAMTFVPFASTRGFVVSAGTTTFRLVCNRFAGTVVVGDSNINAIWVPRAY